jgi:hypothetical protein
MQPHNDRYERGQQHLLSGALLNRKAQRLNASMGYSVDSGTTMQTYGQTIRPVRANIEVFTVTGDSDFCGKDELGHTEAPCDSEFLYLGTVKYFDGDDRRWINRDEEYTLDSGATETHYKAGDIIPVHWDKLRGAYVPLRGAPGEDTLTPRYHAMLTIGAAGISVLQADNDHRDAVDQRNSYVELYCQVARGDREEGWQTIGKLSWRVPWLDTQRSWQDTRSGFVTLRVPDKSQFRFIVGGAWHPHPDDDHDDFEISQMEWMAFGLTPWARPPHTNVFETGLLPDVDQGQDVHQKFLLLPGNVIEPFLRITEVQSGRISDPTWVHSAERITQKYEDPEGEWLTGIHFQATLRSNRNVAQRFEDGDLGNWFTSLECSEEQKITEKCTTRFGFAGGIGNRINLQSSNSQEMCNGGCVSACGTCVWEWMDEDPGGAPVDPFWNLTDPCKDTGPESCACSEPTVDGAYVGQFVETLCIDFGSSSSSRSSTTSSTFSSLSSTSTKSSISTSSTLSSSSQS